MKVLCFKSDGVVDWAQITTLMVEENKAVCVCLLSFKMSENSMSLDKREPKASFKDPA